MSATGKICEFEFRPPDPNAEIVDKLESLLAMAKKGEIQRFIYSAQTHDHAVFSGWRLRGSFVETAGLAAILQHSILSDDILRLIDEGGPAPGA